MNAPIREEIKRISLSSAHAERPRSILDAQPSGQKEAEPSLFVKLRTLVVSVRRAKKAEASTQADETDVEMSEKDYENVARSLGHEGLTPLDLGDEEHHTNPEDTEEAPQKRSP